MMLQPLAYPELERAGRLGNQLWQIASTLGLARSRRMRPLFPSEWSYRDFFCCPDEWFGTVPPSATRSTVLATRLDPRCRPYLQDLSLWAAVQEEVRRAFDPSPLAFEVIDYEWNDQGFADLPRPICAMHVRRGDYATNPKGTLTSLPVDYYIDAQLELEPASVAIFSDDIDWCLENLYDGDLYYRGVSRPKEQESNYMTVPVLDWVDLFLMARCDMHIISNSTYSWWGAWLADSQAVAYPSRWFGEDMASFIDFRAMIPDGWNEMEVEDRHAD